MCAVVRCGLCVKMKRRCQSAFEAVKLQYVEHPRMSVRKVAVLLIFSSVLSLSLSMSDGGGAFFSMSEIISTIPFLCNVSLLNLQSRSLVPLFLNPTLISSLMYRISNCQNYDKHNRWCILLAFQALCLQLLPLLLNKPTALCHVSTDQ